MEEILATTNSDNQKSNESNGSVWNKGKIRKTEINKR